VLFRVESLAQPWHRFSVAELEHAAPDAALRGRIAVVATGWSNRAFADPVRYPP